MGLPSAVEAAKNYGSKLAPGTSVADVLVSGYDLSAFPLSDADNAIVSKTFLTLAQGLLDAGYELLVSDRGWWAAQESFNAENLRTTDGKLKDSTTLESWAEKVSQRTEIDLWAYQ